MADERQEKVHPGRQYGVFILSHGRPDKQLTYTTLRREGYTGPIRIVCDDEDDTVPQYQKNFPGEVLVFNKVKEIARTETFYNKPYHKAVIYARGTLYDFSRQLGWTHFIMMDDDYYHIYFKWNHYYKEIGLTRFKGMEAQRLDELFDATFDLLACSPASTISFAQGGDTLGGSSGKAGVRYAGRKAMNSHFVEVSKPLTFRSFVNEDVNLYAEFPFNRFIFQTNRVSVDPAHTQQLKGGATDMYLAFGTYVKSFMSVIANPSAVKVQFMQNGKQQGRLHHLVKTKNAAPELLSGRWKKAEGDESAGLKESQEYIDRDIQNHYEEQYLEVHPNPPESWKTDPIDKTCKINSMRKPKAQTPKKTTTRKQTKKMDGDIPDPVVEDMMKGAVVVQAPKPASQPIHITSVFKVEGADGKPVQAPEPKIELPPEKQTKPPFEIIVDSLENIDPRALGKLMIELNDKVELTIVHGDIFADDVVVKLCSGLGFRLKQLYDASGILKREYAGKRKMTRCQAGERPVFEEIG